MISLFEPVLESVFDVPHSTEHYERQYRSKDCDRIDAESHTHPDSRRDPEARRRRDTVECIAAENYQAATQETDTGDDAGGHERGLNVCDSKVCGRDKIRHHDEKARPHGDKPECPRACRLGRQKGTLGANHRAERHCKRKLYEHHDSRVCKISGGTHILISIKYHVASIKEL